MSGFFHIHASARAGIAHVTPKGGKGAEMSEENTDAVDEQQQEQPKTFTEEQVNSIVKERLKRAKTELPADYEELKAKAAKYDEVLESEKTELERVTEERDRLAKSVADFEAAEAHRKAVAEAVKAHGLNAEDAGILERMTGDVEENAALLAEVAGSRRRYPDIGDDGEFGSRHVMTDDEIDAIKNPADRIKARAQAIANKRQGL